MGASHREEPIVRLPMTASVEFDLTPKMTEWLAALVGEDVSEISQVFDTHIERGDK